MAEYRFLLADKKTGEVRAEMPFTAVSFTRTFGDIGTASASIPMRHPKSTRANIDPGNTALFVVRDGVVVWGGLLWTVKVSGDTEMPMLDLGFEDFLSYFKYRQVQGPIYYKNLSDLTIISNLFYARAIQASNAEGAAIPNIPFPFRVDTSGASVARTREYAYGEATSVYDAVMELSRTWGGPHIRLGFDKQTKPDPNTPGATIPFYKPFVDVSRRPGAYRPDLLFELSGANVKSLGYSEDATRLLTHSFQYGAGDGKTAPYRYYINMTGLRKYGPHEQAAKNSDLADTAVLSDKARGAVRQYGDPVALVGPVEVIVGPNLDPTSYELGEVVRVRAKDGWLNINKWTQIVSDTVAIGQNGDERLTITFSAWAENLAVADQPEPELYTTVPNARTIPRI